MQRKLSLVAVLLLGFFHCGLLHPSFVRSSVADEAPVAQPSAAGQPATAGQPAAADQPVELEVLKASVGVWDAVIEVWPRGPDATSTTFKGVETNRAYGDYWISSDFDSVYAGETVRVHSIVGYDLDKKKLVGRIIDHGPYAATMTGEYDRASSTVHWVTQAKYPSGEPMIQKTRITQKNADTRVLVLMATGDGRGEPTKFMEITFTKRK